jgi:putative colanic acid biosynthesis UDP-glucose lipid carrier transferase
MNFAGRKVSIPDTGAFAPVAATPTRSRPWAISHQTITTIAGLVDALIIISMSVASGVVYHLDTIRELGDIPQFGGFGVVVAVLFVGAARNRDLYTLRELLNLKAQVIDATTIWLSVFLFITGVAFTMKLGATFSRGATLAFFGSGLTVLLGARIGWRVFLAKGLTVHNFAGRKVALIAEKDAAENAKLPETLARHGLQLVQLWLLPADQNDVMLRKVAISEAIQAVRGSDVEEIIVGARPDNWPQLRELMADLRALPLPVNFVPLGPLSQLFNLGSHTIGDTVTIELQRGPRTKLERIVKRSIDIAVAVTALIMVLPLLLLTAAAIKLDSPGPVIFRQRRCGFNGRLFSILKFRTMTVMDDGPTIIPAKQNDTRVTRIGSWLRRTSIDELPQLLNVLLGTMSIVGPRPHAMAHDVQFNNLVSNYAFRQHVKPGLTGWAQVNGCRGELRTLPDIERRIAYDLWYIDNWNFLIDFKIMFMTIIETMRGNNAY